VTALLALAICVLVVWALATPFRERGGRRERGAAEGAGGDGAADVRDAETRDAAGAPAAGGSGLRAGDGASVPARPTATAEGAKADLREERERLLAAIADLRFDFETGKLSRADYEAEDARLRSQAADVLRRLEEGAGGVGVSERA
jgi:hypothetical protein